MRLPIRTWQEKALVAAMFAASLSSAHEALSSFSLFPEELLLAPGATNKAILDYRCERRALAECETLLFAVRRITPGPDAWLEIPPGFELAGGLDELRVSIASIIGDGPHVPRPPMTELIEALYLVVALRAEAEGITHDQGGP